MATLKELPAFTAKTGHCVHVTTISQVLHKSDLHGKVATRKPLLKKYMLGVGSMVSMVGLRSEDFEFKSCLAVDGFVRPSVRLSRFGFRALTALKIV